MLISYVTMFYMSAKEKALQLRKQGYSYSYIAKATGLSKSTLSYHLATLPYTPNAHTKKNISNAKLASNKSKYEKKLTAIASAQKVAKKEIGTLSDRDLFLLGIGLYIGEGSKTQNLVRLVNADPKVIRLFIAWLHLLGLQEDNIALRIHLYPDSDIQSSEQYWLQETNLPKTSLQRPCIDTRLNKDRKRNKVHANGTAHVTVRANGQKRFGVALSRKIGAYMQEVLQ